MRRKPTSPPPLSLGHKHRQMPIVSILLSWQHKAPMPWLHFIFVLWLYWILKIETINGLSHLIKNTLADQLDDLIVIIVLGNGAWRGKILICDITHTGISSFPIRITPGYNWGEKSQELERKQHVEEPVKKIYGAVAVDNDVTFYIWSVVIKTQIKRTYCRIAHNFSWFVHLFKYFKLQWRPGLTLG